MMKIFSICALIFILIPINQISAEDKNKKVVYKFKKYERFDLGNLEIKGSIIAPGDLSVKERERKHMQTNLFHKKNFLHEIKNDVERLK